MLGVRKRVKRMVRAVEHVRSTPGSRRESESDNVGGVGHHSQGGVLAIFDSQRRQGSFNSPQPLPLTGGGSGPLLLGGGSNGGGQPPSPGRGSGRGSGAKGEGGCSGRGSGRSDDTRGLSSQLNSSRDAQNSSGDDTPGLPLSRLHSYSKMRPITGGEAAAALPFPTSAGGGVGFAPSTSGSLGRRPPSFTSGALGMVRPPSFTSGRPASFSSRGKASELAVLAGLRQASLGRGGFGAVMAGDKPPPQPNLPTMNEGSFGGAAVSELNSSQSRRGSAPPPRPHLRQNTDVNLDRLSGEKLMRLTYTSCVGW